jgi:hypothetical protein
MGILIRSKTFSIEVKNNKSLKIILNDKAKAYVNLNLKILKMENIY